MTTTQDCTFLCSAQAAIDHHQGHDVQDYREVTVEMEEIVTEAADQSRQLASRLHDKIEEIKALIRTLDEQEEASILHIGKTFRTLHTKLKKREQELLEKVTNTLQSKRKLLLHHLAQLSDVEEDCQELIETSTSIINETNTSTVEKMYLVAATQCIDDRSDTLTDNAELCIAAIPTINVNSQIEFIAEDLLQLQARINTLGRIVDVDHTQGIDSKADSKTAQGVGVMKNSDSKVLLITTAADQIKTSPVINFTVIIER